MRTSSTDEDKPEAKESQGNPIDFPVSWDWHRHYSLYYYGIDPGPNEPPEHRLEELQKRLEGLENLIAKLSPEDLRQYKLKHIYEEVEQLRQGLRYTQRLIPRKPARKRAPKRVVTTEV